MLLYSYCIFVLLFYNVDSESGCNLDLGTADNRANIYLNVLKWLKPKTSSTSVPNGGTVDMECGSGFLQHELQSDKYTFQCTSGTFNRTYQYRDLLCRSDFHKNDLVEIAPASQINSKILKCDDRNWVVYKVKVRNNDNLKHVYTVCFDKVTMRPKFSYRPRSNTAPKYKYSDREHDVWGYDGFGANTDEKFSLSTGYVKNTQQHRVTNSFKEKYNRGKTYPYYFNRGHLVPYADFSEELEKRSTSQYINAAPQWDFLNTNSWSLVEREVRDLLKTDTIQWEVYTGTYGAIPTTRGPLNLAPIFDSDGKFKKAFLPVPMLFWKIAHNKANSNLTRVFVGVNNPEIRTSEEIVNQYKICNFVKNSLKGSEFFGFTYECLLDEFLNKLRSENIVK